MEKYQQILDMTMCLLWIITYTLCCVSTIKYQHPALAPITQLIIAPFEFAVLAKFIMEGSLTADYISASYIYWTLVEITLVVLMLKYAFHYERKKIAGYLAALILMTFLMFYLCAVKDNMFFFSYFNTFIGEGFWFYYILRDDYPMKPWNLVIFITKFVGDAISIPVYLHTGTWVSTVICVLLPILDLCFIVVYFIRTGRIQRNREF